MMLAKIAISVMTAFALKSIWSARRKRVENSEEEAPEQDMSKAIIPYSPLRNDNDAEEIPELPLRHTGWLLTFSTSCCDAATLYRYGDRVILALTGNTVAIATIVNASTYIVKAQETFFHDEVPGLRICLTTTLTLDVVPAAQIAWELGLANYSDEEVENKILEGIYRTCGYWVPLAVMSWA